MPNIRIFIRAVSSSGEITQERHYNVALGI